MKIQIRKGITGWTKGWYFHAKRITYPGMDCFQIRVYDRENSSVVFQRTWK